MANKTRWIKSRIKSIIETKKITRAMYLISASKMKRARERLENTRPYFQKINELMKDIVIHGEQVNHIIFTGHEKAKDRIGILVISGDKGLCGGYNANIIRATLSFANKFQNKEIVIFPIGNVGRNFFKRKGFNVYENFNFIIQEPTIKRAKDISFLILRNFYNGEFSEIYIVYTKLITAIKQEVTISKLLPLDINEFIDKNIKKDEKIIYHPSAEETLNVIIFEYFKGNLFGSMVESYTSELASRMTAMDNATKSADEMISKLTLKLNRERQAVITQEISEIIGGAAALK
ncbi:ATP synthase F1 subunit gamma [Caldicellulosiruptoraceae bacterium PP1]